MSYKSSLNLSVPPRAREARATREKPGQPSKLVSTILAGSPAAIQAAEELVLEEWRVGDLILNLYQVKDSYAGGMGTVYRVLHQKWGQDLAVKSPKLDKLEQAAGLQAFVEEAETWVNLGLHPNVVYCYYVRTLGGIPRVFCEFIEGSDLADAVATGELYQGGQAQSLPRILDIAIQFAWGLAYAHEQGLIHQDVKPSNVMLSRNGEVKVTDFGLARSFSVKGSAVVGGTEAYYSPEQAQLIDQTEKGVLTDKRIALTTRTDIWSWAVSVFEMLLGEPPCPYGGQEAREVFDDFVDGRIQPLPLGLPPASVIGLLRQCLEPDPDSRPANLNDVATELQSIYLDVTGKIYPRRYPESGKGTAASLNNRALSLLDIGREKEALSLWQKAIAADPQHVETIFNRGTLLWRRGMMTDDALIQLLTSAHEFYGHDWVGEYLLGLVNLERGARLEALQHLKSADAASDKNADVADALNLAQESFNQVTAGGLATPIELRAPARVVALSPDGELALTGNQDGDLYIWNLATGTAAKRLSGHRQAVNSVCFSPDGKQAVSGSADKSAVLWDVETGSRVREFKTSNSERARELLIKGGVIVLYNLLAGLTISIPLSFLFASKANSLTTLFKQNPEVMQLLTQFVTMSIVGLFGAFVIIVPQLLRRVEKGLLGRGGHKGSVTAVAISPDGNLIASGSSDKTVRIWDVKTGRQVRTFFGHKRFVTSVCFSPDGEQLLSGSNDQTARLWNVKTGEDTLALKGHKDSVNAVTFCDEGNCALTASSDSTVRLWKLSDGASLVRFVGHTQPVTSLSEVSNGGTFVSAGWDKTVRAWEASTGRCIRTYKDLPEPVTSVAFGYRPLAVSAGVERCLRLHEVPEEIKAIGTYQVSRVTTPVVLLDAEIQVRKKLNEAMAALRSHDYPTALALTLEARGTPGFERAGECLAVWNELAQHCLRTGVRGLWIVTVLMDHGDSVRAAALSEDGKIALTGADDQTIRVWNTETGEILKAFDMGAAFTALCLSHDGTLVLSASSDQLAQEHSIRVWDLHKRDWRKSLQSAQGRVDSLCLTRDNRLAVGACGAKINVWDVNTGICLRRLSAQTVGVTSVCLSADDRMVIAGGRDGRVRTWDIATGRQLKSLDGHGTLITSICTSADGHLVLTTSADATARVWNLETGESLCTLTGHRGVVTSGCVTDDGQFGITGSDDHTLAVWELKTGRLLKKVRGHEDSVRALCLSRDGRFALSAGDDKTARLWTIDWLLKAEGESNWSEDANNFINNFLILHTPFSETPLRLTEFHLRQMLTKRGEPVWKEADKDVLIRHLGYAGFGRIRPTAIGDELYKRAAEWQGAKPLVGGRLAALESYLLTLYDYQKIFFRFATKNWVYATGLISAMIVLPVVVVLLYFLGAYLLETAPFAEQRWKTYTKNEVAAEFKLPCEPAQDSAASFANYEGEVESQTMLKCDRASLTAAITYATYSPQYANGITRKITDSFEFHLYEDRSYQHINCRKERYKEGELLTCSYEIDERRTVSRLYVIVQGRHAWKLEIENPEADGDANGAVTRILESFNVMPQP